MADLEKMQELAILWTRHQTMVGAFIHATVSNYDLAEELTQRVAAELVKIYDRYDSSRPFGAWAIGVAKMEVLRHRQTHAADRHVFDSGMVESLAGAFQNIEGRIDPMKEALSECLNKVQPRSRAVLDLRYGDDAGVEDIARKMGLKPNAVYVLIHRVRNELRDCIERRIKRGVNR